MHRNGYLLVYINYIRKIENTIDSLLSNIFIFCHAHVVVGHKWEALIRAVTMSQECTQPSMQMFPSVTNYFSTGLVMTLQSQWICIP